MPNSRTTPAFATYQQILDGLIETAMALAHRLTAEMRMPEGSGRTLDPAAVTRGFLILSTIVRRSIVVARYLEETPLTAEEKANRIMPVLDLVLAVFAKHKMDIETYNAMVDAELDGEEDEVDEDGELIQTDVDVSGRRPCILVAELCRDFGLVTPILPATWLDEVAPDLRFLCARAAAAAIGPSPKPAPHADRPAQW